MRDSDYAHADCWPELQSKYMMFQGSGYEHIPRGRVVYNDHEAMFIVYSSRQIIENPNARKIISDAFDLEGKIVEWLYDEHYQPVLDLGYEDECEQ